MEMVLAAKADLEAKEGQEVKALVLESVQLRICTKSPDNSA